MIYDEENIKNIKEDYAEIDNVYTRLMLNLSDMRLKLTNEKACEYLVQGVCRRLNILTRCIHNIFKIFPIEKTDLLPRDDLTDLSINLHAFFVNISGILDNLGWVFVYENDLFGSTNEKKIDKYGVGLFNKKTQKHLNPELNDYLESEIILKWYTEYSKNYRDALAHRIPPYVPPSVLDKEQQEEYMLLKKQLSDFNSLEAISQHDEIQDKLSKLGQACPFFAHSLNEENDPMFLHAQVLVDFVTIEEIIDKFCDYFKQQNL